MTEKRKLVRLPAERDDTVTLAPLFDFRAPPRKPEDIQHASTPRNLFHTATHVLTDD